MNEIRMMQDLNNARKYSLERGCTVWAFSNGQEITWSDSRCQMPEGFWVCAIFEFGNRVEI